jgi:hypothetical protein
MDAKKAQELVKLALAGDAALIMECAGTTPDSWQAKVLRTRPRQLLLNCSRQSGKSSTVAAGAIDEALFCPESLTLVLSPSLRQSQELFRVVMEIHRKIGIEIDPESESSLRAEFPNGSRIIALPGGKEANIRGFASVSLLIVDEAARVPDDLYRAVRPMLAVSGGRIWILSTPFGKRGFFFKEWMEGEGWDRVRITAEQCPRIPREFLEQERRSMPETWFRQEYFCEFADTEGAVFRYEDVMAALSDNVKPLFPAEDDGRGSGILDSSISPSFA